MTASDYSQVSHATWQRMAEGWDRERRWVWDSSRHISEWMVAALDPRPGQTILELAAGTGETGFAVAERIGSDGRLISTDFSPNMVEAARKEARRLGLGNVEHRVLDAQNMDLEDHSIDGVLCRWGFMLMADPGTALAETRRVLRPSGRLALSVWADPARNPWASIPGRIVNEHMAAPPPPPDAPGIFAMADPERTRSLLAAAGLKLEKMENIEMTWHFPDTSAVWRFLTTVAGAIALMIAALPEQDQAAVRRRIETAIEPFKSTRGYELPGALQNTLATA